jgi:hypothetical protein
MGFAERFAEMGISEEQFAEAMKTATTRAYRENFRAAMAEAKTNTINRRFKLDKFAPKVVR